MSNKLNPLNEFFCLKVAFVLLLSLSLDTAFVLLPGSVSQVHQGRRHPLLQTRENRNGVFLTIHSKTVKKNHHHEFERPATSSSFRSSTPSEDTNRRNFLLHHSMGTALISMALFPPASRAITATNNTSSGDVDWNAFGQQLQTFPPPGSSSQQMRGATTSGSDLEKALQDASKRKTIDPRTHG